MSSSSFRVHRYTGAQGLALAADVGGDPAAPSVILMHGGGQTRHSWGSAMEPLIADGFQVINFDARGHGDSDWSPDGDYSLAMLAEDLRAIIATLPSLPALVGASMGGVTSLYAAGNSDPQIARALVLVDIVPRVEAAGARKIGQFMRASPEGFASLEEASDAVAAYYPHRTRPKDTSGLMKNLRRREDGRLHWHWDPRIVARAVRPEPPQFTDLLLAACGRVHIPSLLVRGLQSDIVGEAGVVEFREHLPQLEVFDVSGAGHMVAGDKNDAFNEAVISFLRRHQRERP